MTSIFDQVYRLVQKVPAGKVTTYGEIAKKLGTKDSRLIGWALHANRSSHVPCHRVVNKEGRMATNFAFDGIDEQRRRLEVEGVDFCDEQHVNMDKCFYSL